MTWHSLLAFTVAILATSVLAADDNSVVDNPSGTLLTLDDECPRRARADDDCPSCRMTTATSGFLADPCSNYCFYQCSLVGTDWAISEKVCCADCLMFNVTTITCDFDPDVDCATAPVDLQEEFNCTMAPLNDPRMYIMGNVSMPCPEGTVFKEVNCTCIHDPDYPPPISMNYTIRSNLNGSEFDYTIIMDTTKSPFIVMIREAHKLHKEFMYTYIPITNLGDYIVSINELDEEDVEPHHVWVFMREMDGIECIPDEGVNQYRVTNGEHLIMSYLPRSVYSDVDMRCP